jgi:PDZ domain-containing protein
VRAGEQARQLRRLRAVSVVDPDRALQHHRGPWARFRRRRRWRELHQRLGAHPFFAYCTHDELRRVGRWGDEVDVPAGELLLQEDRIGHWFLVVLSGRVVLTRGRRQVATVGPGGHVGEVAILGFGPQPCTVRAGTDCRLFVIGRRYLISLAHDLPGVQQGLFPGTDPVDFVFRLRELRAEATAAWRRLPRSVLDAAGRRAESPRWLAPVHPSRSSDGTAPPPAEGSFAWLAAQALRRQPAPALGSVAAGVSVRAVALGTTAVLLPLVLAVSLLWHPPVAVVTPGEPVDVTADITVSGVPVHAVNGAYILTPVDVDRPTLAGWAAAVVGGRKVVRIAGGPTRDAAEAGRRGRREFADARRHAVEAAARAAGIDPARLEVRFRPRDLQGPSAALVYALALEDLLDPEDRARGRTVAATGALGDDGRVIAVGFVSEKLASARSGRAVLFIVPRGQGPAGGRLAVREVASFEEAIAALS